MKVTYLNGFDLALCHNARLLERVSAITHKLDPGQGQALASRWEKVMIRRYGHLHKLPCRLSAKRD